MTIKNADMPASPMFSSEAKPCQVRDTDTQALTPASGLTKREHIAAMAMQGLVTQQGFCMDKTSKIAVCAVKCADALLTQLEKDQ
jgi:hypothetical protein